MKLFFSRVASPFGEVENVEVRKRKYENESAERKYGSEKIGSQTLSCVGGAPRPYRKGLGSLSVSSSFLVYATSQGLTVSQRSTEVRRKEWEPHLTSDLETGSWDLGGAASVAVIMPSSMMPQ